ncbi:MAG TPA: nucleotidyltransferase family protein [Mycobacteriales bacterium]|nr:nucleotidyltransferase family protein [Mycobacteriales bacterium]
MSIPEPAAGLADRTADPSADPAADLDLLETVKKAAVELKRAELPFALCGGWAVYARGGPRSEHDADFALLERDVPAALDALAAAGFEPDTDAPEDWLRKVWDRGNLVDLIFRLSGEPVTEDILGRTDTIEVGSVQMPVLSATDLVVTKLLTYRDHYADFGSSLPMVRALREQVDWAEVRQRTEQSPFAEAFLLLVDRLGLTG